MTSMLQAINIAIGGEPKKQAGARKKKPAAKRKTGPKKKPAPKKPTGVRKPAKPTKKPTKKVPVNQCRAHDVKTGNRCTREAKGKELCNAHTGKWKKYAQKPLRNAR